MDHPSALHIAASAILAIALCGCGGTKVLKEPNPLLEAGPLATASDARIAVSIEAVVVRNGPGAWARDGDWDEYRLRIRRLGTDPVEVRRVRLVDATGTPLEPLDDRAALVEATEEVEKRYRLSSTLARDGESLAWHVVAGSGIAAVGTAGTVLVTGMSGSAALLGGGGAASAGALAVAPLMAVGGVAILGVGVVRMINRAEVDDEIKRRRTALPSTVSGPDAQLVLFYPMTPVPMGLEVSYASAGIEHRLELDTRKGLANVHAPPPARLVQAVEPQFPPEAVKEGVRSGWVQARLTIAQSGDVVAVEVIQAVPPRLFTREALATFRFWKYTPADTVRQVTEVMEFRR